MQPISRVLKAGVIGPSFRLFALHATRELGSAIAERLGCPLSHHEERDFEEGEHKIRPLDNVRGADVYVLQSTHGGPAEKTRQRS